jgi:hypothetical protein
MNERIRELSEQAFRYSCRFSYGDYSPYATAEFKQRYDSEFAELIVRECIWKIMLCKEEAVDNYWHVDEAMSTAIKTIQEYFGVEE